MPLLSNLTMEQSASIYKDVLSSGDTDALRRLCREDLFFLLSMAFKRSDLNHPWLYARCREVESAPDGYIDLWSREHYKSTIITYAKTIQDILIDPSITVGIFSHTRPIAKAFLTQIKREFEDNTFLQGLFPDVLYTNPQKESSKWSLDDGIIVRRDSNPKESTVEAWGLVDGQPTSKHYNLLVYDDVVTKESVSTPEMIKKVTESFGLSLNLGAKGGKRRIIGTRYHANDTYNTIISRGSAQTRTYPATDDGTFSGTPVFLTREELDDKIRDMGSYVASCQLLQNPLADTAMGFKLEWLMYYNEIHNTRGWNFYLICDPAGEKKKTNDYTVILVIGLAPDNNYYLVDGVRDRLNLTERTKWMFKLHRKWIPKCVGYEKYGMQSDIEHIKFVQELENYRFGIVQLGGQTPKNDRIRKLVPVFENNRFYIPHRLPFRGADGKAHDFISEFITDEYETFPVSTHDDIFDCMARILDNDLNTVFPKIQSAIPNAIPMAKEEFDVLDTAYADYQQTYNPLANIA